MYSVCENAFTQSYFFSNMFYDWCRDAMSVDKIRSSLQARRLSLESVIDRRGRHFDYPLCAALAYANLKTVHFLLDNGASVNISRRGNYETPLYIASSKSYVTVAKRLVAYGAFPNTRCKFGDTALFAAARSSCPGIVAELIAHGASVSILNDTGETALHQTSKGNGSYLAAAKCLVAAGIDIHHANADGETALDIAMTYGKSDLISYFLECGAEV